MLTAEDFLCGSAAPCAFPALARRWLRPALQWFCVVLAHVALLGIVLEVSPQARQTFGEIVQASLIAPRVPPVAEAPVPPPKPVAKRPRPPVPVLAAAPRAEAPPSSFLVPEAPAEPAPSAAPQAAEAAAVAPPPLVPPVFNAAYLDNPPPQYPPASRRLGEKGRVVLRIFVSADGRAERIEVGASSGFARLDEAARAAVAGWRFVPARRGDAQVAAWVQVPIVFVM